MIVQIGNLLVYAAVARVNGQLAEFCISYRRSKRLPNMTGLLLTGLASGVGNKGNKVTGKRKREEICSHLPLKSTQAETSSSSSTTITSLTIWTII